MASHHYAIWLYHFKTRQEETQSKLNKRKNKNLIRDPGHERVYGINCEESRANEMADGDRDMKTRVEVKWGGLWVNGGTHPRDM
ncbi:hypothetical protein J6590_037348 [Homalodisca vitripennis]|nr:hypothetical protein J6590_037348 [Homalodisca vitripennis]